MSILTDQLTTQNLLALGFVGGMVAAAFLLAHLYLPQRATGKVRFFFTWLAFDAICHLLLEGSFLYLSTFGRTVNKSHNFFAYLWQDYARADARWGTADSTVVSLEILTVLGAGPLAAYCAYLLAHNDGKYHFWINVLSTAELYGGAMTFFPEWISGSKALDGSNFLFLWVYLFFMNMAWVVIPLYLMVDSYAYLNKTLKQAGYKLTPAATRRASTAVRKSK